MKHRQLVGPDVDATRPSEPYLVELRNRSINTVCIYGDVHFSPLTPFPSVNSSHLRIPTLLLLCLHQPPDFTAPIYVFRS
jgi:hypothetical protein